MLLIADSGSTKTDWLYFDNQLNEFVNITSMGMNPMLHSTEQIFDFISQNIDLKEISNQVTQLYFYGAGCSTIERNQKMKIAFKDFFKNANIHINHDLNAAVIALHGDNDGISCILGTGSNSVLQKDGVLIDVMPSLGFILGDEAGGVYFGKKILQDYFYKMMPESIYDYCHNNFEMDKEIVLKNIYQSPTPNRYIATFSRVLSEFRHTKYVQDILFEGFDLFFKIHILCFKDYQKYPIGCIGSIAYTFSDELKKVAKIHHTSIDNFIKKPIERLYVYHENKLKS